MRPPVSVIMPNYNHGQYVALALRSILDQLTDADELIVIDDASTDDSVSQIERVTSSFANSRFLRHGRNVGAPETMNEGLALAAKSFVCFPGADDLVVPGAFNAALAELMKHESAGFCSGLTLQIDSDGTVEGRIPTRIIANMPCFLRPEQVARQLMRDDTWILGLTFFRTDALKEAGGFRAELSSFADGFTERLIALRHGCCFVPQTLQLWRRAAGGLAWSESLDMDHIEAIGKRVCRLMSGTYADDFPPGYADVWLGRWRFGAERLSLKVKQAKRWKFLTGKFEQRSLPAYVLQSVMSVLRVPVELALFLKYRPRDLWSVTRRRIGLIG